MHILSFSVELAHFYLQIYLAKLFYHLSYLVLFLHEKFLKFHYHV